MVLSFHGSQADFASGTTLQKNVHGMLPKPLLQGGVWGVELGVRPPDPLSCQSSALLG